MRPLVQEVNQENESIVGKYRLYTSNEVHEPPFVKNWLRVPRKTGMKTHEHSLFPQGAPIIRKTVPDIFLRFLRETG